MRNIVAFIILVVTISGCNIDIPSEEIKSTPNSFVCGWFRKGTYIVGDADVILYPHEGSAVSVLETDPCDVNENNRCWKSGTKVQLWSRFDTYGEIQIEKLPCIE